MNYYEADVSKVIKGLFPKDQAIDVGSLLRCLHETSGMMHRDKGTLERVIQSLYEETGVMPTPEHVATVLKNAPIQMFWETLNILYGTTIYVHDPALVAAMLRTDVEAVMDDVRLPFPVCEFAFPSHLPLGIEDFEISGCLLIDTRQAPIERVTSKAKDLPWNMRFPEHVTTVFFVRLQRAGGKIDPHGVSWLQFDPTMPLDSIPQKVPMRDADRQALRAHCKLCFGLCLYTQTKEGQKAMEKMEPHKQGRHSIGPAEGREHKRKTTYRIRDLITHTFHAADAPMNGTHASPKMHWRKLHLRTLRHERYARNHDGSVRAVWVSPALINAGNDDAMAHAERILK